MMRLSQMTLAPILAGLLAGLVLLHTSPANTVVLSIGCVVASITLRHPLYCLAAFAFFATVLPYSTVSLGVRITVSELMLLLATGGTMLGLLGRPNLGTRLPASARAIRLLMFYSLLPLLIGNAMIPESEGAFVKWVRWMISIVTVFLVLHLVRERIHRDRLVDAMLLGTALMALASIALYTLDPSGDRMLDTLDKLNYPHPEAAENIFSGTRGRLASPWIHPNLLGGAMALILPMTWGVLVTARGVRWWLAAATLAFGLGALMMSISRGAILAAGTVAIAHAFMLDKP